MEGCQSALQHFRGRIGDGGYKGPRREGRGRNCSAWRLRTGPVYRISPSGTSNGSEILAPTASCTLRARPPSRRCILIGYHERLRAVALAILNSATPLSRKAGSFLGQVAVDPTPLSVAQRDWLNKLEARAGMNNIAEEAQA